MEKTTMSVQELSAQMGISLPKAYELVKSPGFPSIRIGTRILIPIRLNGRYSRILMRRSSIRRLTISFSGFGMADVDLHQWAKCRFYPECSTVLTVGQNCIRYGIEAGSTIKSISYALPTAKSRVAAVPIRSEM